MRTYTLVLLFALLAVTLGLPTKDEEFQKSKTEVADEIEEKEVKNELADAAPEPAIVNFISLGCWNDHFWRRAFKSNSVRYGKDTIQKCADRARLLGNIVFAVQHKTQCWTAGTQGAQYQLYGTSSKCKNGRGAGVVNSVYQLGPDNRNQKWLNLGCFKDEDGNGRAFQGGHKNVDDGDAHNECRNLAIQRGHNYFGLENGFFTRQCFTGNNVALHTRHGVEKGCSNGRGGNWHLNVFQVLRPGAAQVIYNDVVEEHADAKSESEAVDGNDEEETESEFAVESDEQEVKSEVADAIPKPAIVNFISLGCWNDHFWRRAFKSNSVRYGKDTIQKCADRARLLGNIVFAVQHKTQCWTAGTQGAQYQLYGTSSKCKNGRGAGVVNSVYQLGPDNRNQKWLNLGCFKDEDGNGRAFKGGHKNVDDGDAHNECRNLAIQRGHNYFGLENGFFTRQCFTGNNVALHTRHGVEKGCSNGRGGNWHLNVYQVLRPGVAQVIYNDAAEEEKAL